MRILLLPVLLCAAGLPATLSTAEAAPSPSPFAGAYEGYVPGGPVLCRINVSADGQVSGWGNLYSPIYFIYQTVAGSVNDSGRMRCTVTITTPKRGGGRGNNNTTTTRFQAMVGLDGAGNIVGTTDGGSNFVWYRL